MLPLSHCHKEGNPVMNWVPPEKKKKTSLFTNFKLYMYINFCCLEGIEINFELLEEKDVPVGLLGKCCIRELKPSGEQRTMLRYTRQVPKSAQTLESDYYHTR